MEQQLITLADILEYYPISDKLEDTRVGPSILEAQECDIRPILNDAFYNYVCKNIEETEIQGLIYGKEYTYQGIDYSFSGLAPVLAYYTLARFIPRNPISVTRFGVVHKTAQQSTPVEPAVIQAEVKQLRSTALAYQMQLITFLERNKADYPLWDTEGQDTNKGRPTAFTFFRGT